MQAAFALLVACTGDAGEPHEHDDAAVDAMTSRDDAGRADDAGPPDGTGPPDDARDPDDAGAPPDDAAAPSDAPIPTDAEPPADAATVTLGDILDRVTFDAMFPHRLDPACRGEILSYDALVTAAARFPAFLATGSADDRRRDAAAFLANSSHETTGGWPTAPDGPHAWGLCFREEIGCETGACTGYCDPTRYACVAGQTYHGRGPMQLSWNYNYAQAGDALGIDLLTDPGLVARDGVVAWLTAIWFWMTAQPPKPSCHDVMIGAFTPSAADVTAGRLPGFGLTVNIINGGLECGIAGDARVADRVGFYTRYTTMLSVDPGSNLTCEDMDSY
jgi:chitinase